MSESHLTDEMDYPQEALGESEAFLDFQEQLSRVAAVERPVLIIGERGTGKELAAKRLHFLSRRWDGPLVELNCAALAPTLIESELFGHEVGAFTGATQRRRGRFEAAHGGTLFLDELGNIPLPVQEKILRVVEYGSFERVGGAELNRVNVRIVGATNANLARLAEEKRFMRDLLDRLSFEVLHLPPLRDRKEDILLLARHFASRMAYELGRQDTPRFSAGVERALESHEWRGNVRELKNVVERAVYKSESSLISELVFDPFAKIALYEPGATPHDLPEKVVPSEHTHPTEKKGYSGGWKACIHNFEVTLLRQALQDAQYNQKTAAEQLQLSYHQFRGLYRKYREGLEN